MRCGTGALSADAVHAMERGQAQRSALAMARGGPAGRYASVGVQFSEGCAQILRYQIGCAERAARETSDQPCREGAPEP
eukprot:7138119-Alexandrium_andersonii.AAC.1